MSKRISDAEKVMQFFQRADESAIAVMFDVIKVVLSGRNFDKPKAKKVSKPKLVPPALPAVAAPSLKDSLANSLTGSLASTG